MIYIIYIILAPSADKQSINQSYIYIYFIYIIYIYIIYIYIYVIYNIYNIDDINIFI